MSMRDQGADVAEAGPSALSVTRARLLRLCPAAKPAIVMGLADRFDALAPAHGLVTRLRLIHFLAQAAHESDRFQTLVEYGGAAYFARYDGRRDLGNVRPGDGARYRGRGLFQLTGRSNYRRFGALLGIDLEHAPERAAEPEISLRVAFAYWTQQGLNRAADADDLAGVTRLINGGRNGLADRARLLERARSIWHESGAPALTAS